MARRPRITNQQILEAAREVFFQKGFGGSTLEIAQKAGISEASIFKRFATKEELFFAAMGIPEKPPWVNELETLCEQGELKQNLIQLCSQILEFYRQVMPRIMMLRSRGNNPVPEFGGKEPQPIRDVNMLATFLEKEMNKGRLRPGDPKTLAHILIGTLMNYVFLEQMSSEIQLPTGEPINKTVFPSSQPPTTQSSFVQNLIELLWQGIAPSKV